MEPEIMEVNQSEAPAAKRSVGAVIGRILGRIAIVLLETVLILVIALYGVMFVLAKGPSPTARNLFVILRTFILRRKKSLKLKRAIR